MAIAFDSASSDQSAVLQDTVSFTHTFTAAAGTKVYLVGCFAADFDTDFLDITVDGTSMVEIRTDGVGTPMQTSIFVLANFSVPADQTSAIVATGSATAAASIYSAGIIALTGAHPYNQVDSQTGATATATSISASLDPAAPNSWIVSSIGNDGGNAIAATGSNTERFEEDLVATHAHQGGANGPFTNNTTFGGSGGALNSNWSLSMVAIAPLITISKSESVTISESRKQQVFSFVNKSDSITVTENVNPTQVFNALTSDTVSISESVPNPTLVHTLQKSESITITENIPRPIVSYSPNVSDSITITESIGRTQVENLIIREELGAASMILLLPHQRPATRISDNFYYPL